MIRFCGLLTEWLTFAQIRSFSTLGQASPYRIFVPLYNALGLPALLHRRNRWSSLGKKKSETNSEAALRTIWVRACRPSANTL